MTVYLILFAAVFILSVLNLSISKEKMKIIFYIFMAFMILFVGLRKDLGGSDYYVYKAYFDAVPAPWNLGSFNYFIHYKFLYMFLNSLVKIFSTNFFWLTLLVAAITLSLLFTQMYKYMKYPFFAFLFYLYKTFFYTNFVILRQSIAMMIFFFAIKFIIEKKFIKYVICILIASLFHTTALILLPLYFLNRFDFSKINPYLIVVVSFLLGSISKYILEALVYVAKFAHMAPSVINKIQGMTSGIQGAFNPHMVEALFYVVLFSFMRKIVKTKTDTVFYNLFIVYVSTLFMFSRFTIFVRISMYFYISIMYLMSKRIEVIKSSKVRLLVVYLLGLIFLLGYIKYLQAFDNGGLMPYRWIFTQSLLTNWTGV